MKIIIICFLASTILIGQSQNNSFVSSDIQSGLPKEIPFKWSNTSYAKINSGEFYKALYIVSKDSFQTFNESFLFVIKKEGFSYSPLSFKNNETIINLTNDDEDLIAPLKITLALDKGIILYSWGNNTDGSANPYVIKEYELKIGKIFPVIKIDTPSGSWTNDNKNKIIVINWWATSCVPCIEEMPGLNELAEKYKNDNIEFISIVWDRENHSEFIKKHSFIFKQCFGDKNTTSLLGETFPRNLIIDKNGVVVYNKLGANKNTYLELEKIIQKLM